jgi:hypothetical protein
MFLKEHPEFFLRHIGTVRSSKPEEQLCPDKEVSKPADEDPIARCRDYRSADTRTDADQKQ